MIKLTAITWVKKEDVTAVEWLTYPGKMIRIHLHGTVIELGGKQYEEAAPIVAKFANSEEEKK